MRRGDPEISASSLVLGFEIWLDLDVVGIAQEDPPTGTIRHLVDVMGHTLAGKVFLHCLEADWVGFGDRPRPPLKWSPEIYRFLAYLLNQIVPGPFATIAAGHAAAYCLDAAVARPGSTGRLCLIAPTWRGPLPTMMGRKHPIFAQISRMVDWPVVGDLLYRLNVNRFMVRKMALGHVYAESSSLSEARIRGEAGCDTRVGGSPFFDPLCCRRT